MTALRSGHCFIGYDLLSDTTGFRFSAVNSSGSRIQGDDISLDKDTRLKVSSPLSSRVVILKDGQVVSEESGVTTVDWKVTTGGVYRVELYLPELGELAGQRPWIISNPIYVK
jgi:hypothetical protein